MFETNEEITQRLKQSICNYYMGYIKQKLKFLLANGKENEINEQILQFLDAQMDTGNSIITKDDITRILESALLEEKPSTSDIELKQNRISYCFPVVATITIENGQAAYLTEKIDTLFYGIEESSYYLYVSPEYYHDNIENIESKIKDLEKVFSKKDLKDFEEKFQKDLSLKQYEFESAKVYESASNQIELKKQKFNNISTKMINEYGRKYDEIMSKDLSQNEKNSLTHKLYEETKAYDEKNRQAISRLNAEYEKLTQNFQGKVQNTKTIYKQMQNLHLFDKNRYFEDMKASIVPELGDLYKKRYLLNSYRISHNETIYTGKPNAVVTFLGNIVKNVKKDNKPLQIGPHFERDFSSRNF